MTDPFGPAWRYAFLVPQPAAVTFGPADVVTVPPDSDSPADAGGYVPLFRSPGCMARWIRTRLDQGGDAGLVTAPTRDALTSMLVELRKLGVTHVAIDPEPGCEPALVTIERAVIGFEMYG